MCLGVPGEVKEVRGTIALVDFWGVQKEVRLDTVDEEVEPGDYILNHVGFAIARIPEEEVDETLEFFDGIMEEEGRDLRGQDMMDELEAGQSVDGRGTRPGSPAGSSAEADPEDAEDLLEELGIDV